jgi:alpha-galactosidase
VKKRLKSTKPWEDKIIPGHFYDLDMLEIGVINKELVRTPLTDEEELFSYTLRAFFISPIQLSCDLRKLTDFEMDMICNEEIIALNQDAICDFPKELMQFDDRDAIAYVRNLENGDKAIAVFNSDDEALEAQIPLDEEMLVRDVWEQKDLGSTSTIDVAVAPHCVRVFRLSK